MNTISNNTETDLPEGWSRINLGLAVESMKNGIYKPANKYGERGVACLRMYNIDDGKLVWKNVKRMLLTLAETQEYLLAPGDLLVNRVNSRELVGKTAVFPYGLAPCVYESKNIRVRLLPGLVNSDFVNYQLLFAGQSYFNFNSQQVVGMASISQPQIAAFPILLPPREEQNRIVSEIKALFSKIERIRTHIANLQEIVRRFRKAVLVAACSGSMTADWRQNYVNELQSDIAIDSNDDLPEGWTSCRGDGLFEWSSGKFLPKQKQNHGPFPIYGGNGITGSHDKWLVDKRTIVIGRVGALCGNVFVTSGRCWVTDNAIFAKEVSPLVDLDFVALVYTQANLNANAGGSGQPFVNQSTLDKIEIPIPPKGEQSEIVRRASTLSAIADSVQERATSATSVIHKLTQSILGKAFRGELVPTEAELARHEGREYEPASVLLKRIWTEQANQTESMTGLKHKFKKDMPLVGA